MSKKSSPIFSKFGPKYMTYYRHEDHSTHALCWEERELQKDEETKKFQVVVKAYHVLYTGDNGGPVYEIIPRAQAQHRAVFSPTAVTTAPEAFEDYLRRRLVQYGGPAEMWRRFGLEPPAHSVQSLPGSQAAHDEMYERAARLLGVPEPDLRKKYGHLNPGLQQMNLRNRLRGKGHNV